MVDIKELYYDLQIIDDKRYDVIIPTKRISPSELITPKFVKASNRNENALEHAEIVIASEVFSSPFMPNTE